MYAIIRTGGKQAKVRTGDVLEVERLKDPGEEVTFVPLLVSDDSGNVITGRSQLDGALVTAKVLGESRGPKVDIFTYKNKSGNRRRMGHRQTYTTIEVTGIEMPGSSKKKTTSKGSASRSKAAATPAVEEPTPTTEPASTEEE